MSLKHDNLMLSLQKRKYLIVSSDSLLIMCQSINIITPKRKLEVIQTNIFNRKRCLPSYHFMCALYMHLSWFRHNNCIEGCEVCERWTVTQNVMALPMGFIKLLVKEAIPSLNSVGQRSINLPQNAKNLSAKYSGEWSQVYSRFFRNES